VLVQLALAGHVLFVSVLHQEISVIVDNPFPRKAAADHFEPIPVRRVDRKKRQAIKWSIRVRAQSNSTLTNMEYKSSKMPAVISLKSIVKRMLGSSLSRSLIALRVKYRNKWWDRQMAGKSPREAFSLIYERHMWGRNESEDFFSGSGSHEEEISGSYVAAVRQFLVNLPSKPDAVDLGCGDFNVGKQIRDLCNAYVACDVVPALIERNRKVFSEYDVDFRCLDITEDPLPDGEVIFVRQVLQHLTNEQISRFVRKLGNQKFLVLTEHLPFHENFVPNIDKPMGPGIRLGNDAAASGVVLTSPPFNLWEE